MADAPEIPEATDPFEKQVAISIAVLAVALSVIGNRGDNAKTDAIINTTECSDQWAFYQAKSLKQHLNSLHSSLLEELGSGQNKEALDKVIADLKTKSDDLKKEMQPISEKANTLHADAEKNSAINDQCDHSTLFLQIGVVILSVAILTRWRLFWYIGLALGVTGIVIGVRAFMM